MRNWISTVAADLAWRVGAQPWVFWPAPAKNSWTNPAAAVRCLENFMPLSFFARKLGLCLGLVLATPLLIFGQAGFVPEGGEYGIAGSLPGEQLQPALSLNVSGGYIVWEDNITDGNGKGISARRIDSSLSGSLNSFPVNVQSAGSQEKPKMVLLDNGGAAFVWQGGPDGKQQIYARFLSSSSTWITNDVLVNTYTNGQHLDAGIAKLSNGNVVVVWSSWDQDGSMQGVYGQRFSPTGAKLGGEFPINVITTTLNQRTPVVAGLSDGKFVVAWVSEKQVSELSFNVFIFARRFDASGAAFGGEFQVNTGTNVCANPSVAASTDGGFIVAWGEKDIAVRENSWDVFARTFLNDGSGGAAQRLNTMQFGDQYAPRVAASSSRYLVVWTSLGQDGSWEGVYGQFLQNNGTPAGGEFRVNTTTVSRQINPSVTSDGSSRFLVSWSSFGGGVNSFDLRAQRYVVDSQPLAPPAAPFVTALSSTKLSVTWPQVAGFNVAHYELYADGSSTPVVLTSNMWVNTASYAPNSAHSFRLAYVLTDARISPLSTTASGTTWGYDDNFDGLPDDWQALYWPGDSSTWPSPSVDSDGDGVSNRNEFLAGTNPNDKTSVLRTWIEPGTQRVRLKWNTQPGLMYQVQMSTNFGSWSNLDGPHFAPDEEGSLDVTGGSGAYYRIVRLR